MSSTLSWQQPSPDPRLAARRYLLRRRDCLAPIRTAVLQHPDLAPMIKALLAFATDGLLLAEERRRARPLVHLAFDEAWQLYTPEREHDDAHGPMWPRPIVPLETYLVILPVAYIAREMAGLRLRCGEQRQQREDRDRRHVLEQRDREHALAGVAADALLLVLPAEDTVAGLDGAVAALVADYRGHAAYEEAQFLPLAQQILGRNPDPSGRTYWIGKLRTGLSETGLVNSITASNEFYNKAGGTPSGFITKAHQVLLDRSPTPTETANFTAYLAGGGRRDSVANSIYQSQESRLLRVTALYQHFLHRDPDPSGRTYWANVIRTKGDIALALELASSNEYFNRTR